MALVLQDFIQWQSNTSKVTGNYIKPTSSSIFTIVSLTLIQIDVNFWNNLLTGDLCNFSTTNTLPTGIVPQLYIRKDITQRVSLHTTKDDAINNFNPINLTYIGIGTHTISFDFGKIFKCTANGITGNLEPIWSRTVNTYIVDGSTEWKVINPLTADYNPLDFLPESRQKEKAWQMFSELYGHELALIQNEINPLTNKYKDFINLDSEFLYKILAEFGYNYLADASLLNTDELSVLVGYLKLIHFLKGTRNGLRLVLDLLNYTYTETLWYEQNPKKAPHTFDLALTMSLANVSIQTTANLEKFLRFYVYPIATIVTDLLPFSFAEFWTGGAGVGDISHEFQMNFDIPNVLPLALFLYPYIDGYGNLVTDISGNDLTAQIIPNITDINNLFTFIYNNNFDDLSTFHNNASLIANNPNYNLFNLPYTNGSGNIVSDTTINNNNASIISNPVYYNLFKLLYSEGSGLSIGDTSGLSNNASIISNPAINYSLFLLTYVDGTGTTITDTSGLSNNATIIGNTIPLALYLKAWYKLNIDAHDYSGNGLNATLTNGSFSSNKLNLGTTGYLDIPNSVLNGLNDFTIGLWINFNAIDHNSVISLATASNNAFFYMQYDQTLKAFTGVFNGQIFVFGYAPNPSIFDGQSDVEIGEHHICITRNSGILTLYVNGELRAISNIATNSLAVDSGGLIIGQYQTSVGVIYSQSSLNAIIDNLFFYSISLNQYEVMRWYNASRT